MLVRASRSHITPWTPRVATALLAVALARPAVAAAQEAAAKPPQTHTVKRGDTLWDIARTYLGDFYLWPEIYRINADQIEDPHWIYPGSNLRLPALSAPDASATKPADRPASTPVNAEPVSASVPRAMPAEVREPSSIQSAPQSSIRFDEYLAAPFVDSTIGPRGWGKLLQSADVPGITSATELKSRFQLYDRVYFQPPAGPSVERQRLMAYKLGPNIENFGQIVIPTGIVEVTRPARVGEAGIARIVKMFGPMEESQRLMPFDSAALAVVGRPAAVANGRAGTVRWIHRQPVLPTLQSYVVVDIRGTEGIRMGDYIDLYEPRRPAEDEGSLAFPEAHIARAQVVKVTSFGATAIIFEQEQPAIREGSAARIAAKMP